MNFEYLQKIIKDLRWHVSKINALINYKKESMIQNNKTDLISSIDCAISDLNDLKKEILKSL